MLILTFSATVRYVPVENFPGGYFSKCIVFQTGFGDLPFRLTYRSQERSLMKKTEARILIVDDDPDVLFSARLLLQQHFSAIEISEDPNQIPILIQKDDFDIILLDMNFTPEATRGREGLHWLNQVLAIDSSLTVILMTAYGDVEMAVEAIKEGATDFVLKPWQNERLVATISTALSLRESKREVKRLRTRQKQLSADLDSRFHDMIGNSPPMLQVFRNIEKVAKTDANVLIIGENGTGKELVSRALHRQSLRKDEVFISVDMGAISETLFESELFGHTKGAFTDANQNRTGRFEIASGGTLFLDEISNLSSPLQAKLLRVLQERRVVPLGSNKPKPVDIRLLCATNAPIYEMVAKGTFRQDLVYRINTIEIQLPPLRDRGDDILLLVDFFIKRYSAKYKKPISKINGDALSKLKNYKWPGNVRELGHTVERAIIMSEKSELNANDFLFPKMGSDSSVDTLNLKEIERRVIKQALVEHNGNITHAAGDLGLTRAALYRRMKRYDL